MDQVEIDVIHFQTLQAPLQRFQRLAVSLFVVPYFRGYKHLLLRETTLADRAPYARLIPIGAGRIDAAIAKLQGPLDGPLEFTPLLCQERA